MKKPEHGSESEDTRHRLEMRARWHWIKMCLIQFSWIYGFFFLFQNIVKGSQMQVELFMGNEKRLYKHLFENHRDDYSIHLS